MSPIDEAGAARTPARAAGLPAYVFPGSMLAADGSFLWLCIPKNASRSIASALAGRARKVLDFSQGAPVDAWLARQQRPAFTFAFLRDPFDRLASAWRNKVRRPPATEGQAKLFADNPGLAEGMSLESFIDWLADHVDTKKGYVDAHWLPQSHYVRGHDGRRCVDYLGTVETLARDFRDIEGVTGPLGALDHLNPTNRRKKELPPLKIRSRAIVECVYAEDFELLAGLGRNSPEPADL